MALKRAHSRERTILLANSSSCGRLLQLRDGSVCVCVLKANECIHEGISTFYAVDKQRVQTQINKQLIRRIPYNLNSTHFKGVDPHRFERLSVRFESIFF